MKGKILELLNGMNSDSKSASFKCERELCKILTSIIDKKEKIEDYADEYIINYPEKITDVESYGIYTVLPEIIWCNNDEFKFETKWLDIDWETNEELFLAIASLRDDSDYMQWFTDGKKWFQNKQNDIEVIRHGASNPINFHKATVEEIIEHFKDK